MKLKDLEFNEEEIIQSLKDVGIEVLNPGDVEFTDHPTLKEQMDFIEARLKMLDDLYDIAVELDSREFSNNCVISRLTGLSWDELCDKGIEILTKLKERWEENNEHREAITENE
jgi:hypothetical protein